MKKLLLLVLCLCFAGLTQYSQAAVTDVTKETGYISLNTSTTKEVEPNLAKVTFAVENTASDAQKAAAENNEVSNKIISALKALTNEQTDTIKTNNFSVRPVYSSTSTGKRVIKNYTAVNSVTVETKDIKKVAQFIDTAIANGANRTDGLYYSYENDKSVCNDLYPALIKDLKEQAGILAAAAGTSLDGIRHINASCNTDYAVASNGRFYAKASVDSAGSAAESVTVEAGKVKIRVYVNADFYVK